MKKILSFFAAMLVAVAANAAVINIDTSTANAIQGALNSAASGDEIVLAAGTYNESGNYLAFTGKNLTVRAAEGAEVIIKTVCPVRLKEGATAEFINVKFDCSTIGEYEQVIVAADDTDGKRVVLNGCEFYGWQKNKAMIQATSSRRLAQVMITDCYFHDCMKSVVFMENTNPSDLIIRNSTFANISTDASSFWAGVIDSRATSGIFVVDRCTFYNVLAMNTDYAAVGKVSNSASTVTNSIFMLPASRDNVRAIRDVAEAVNCITYNYLKDSGKGIHSDVTKTNCIQQDPLFVNAAEGNFTLGEGSPALTLADGEPVGDPRWVPAAAPAHTYTVAGSSTDLFGTTWAPANTANDMTLQLDGTYKWEKAELTLAAGSIEFKVCQDHVWDPSYPSQNYVLNITEAGIYTITITFDPSNNSVNAVATKTGSAEVLPTVAMHGNFLGSWADTQNFTEADDKATASIKLTLAVGNYEFGMRIGGSGNWTANGTAFTRQNNSAEVVSGQGNLTLVADAAGEYTFTWTYATNNLAITFPEAAQVVKFYVAGSMTSWDDNKIPVYEDSYTFENMAAGKYQMKVVAGAEWKGIDAMTDVAGGLYKDQDGNICFILDEAGNVTVNYTEEAFTMTGNFVAPEMKLIGINGWVEATDAIAMTAAEDKKSTSVKLNLTGEWYDFKVIRDGEWLGKANEGSENYKIWADYNWVDGLVRDYEGLKSVSLQPNGAGEYTFTYDYAAGKLTVTFPTPAPTGITWELNGGAALPKGCDTNEELWEAFKPDYNAFYSVTRSDQPIANVATFITDAIGSSSMMKSETAGWKWLGDYVIYVCGHQGEESWDLTAGSEAQWRWVLDSFFNKRDRTAWPMGSSHAIFTEAGKEEHWLAAYAEMVLPESVSAEYTLPAVYKAEATFGGWYDNAEFSGEALTVIPANYAGALYAKWNSPATNIENTAVDAKVVKLIENGKLIIIRNGVRYNAQGQME